jgi:hypothetical protein
MAPLPVPITPPPPTRRIPMPIFYDNARLSFYAVMLFPDDLTLARKLVAKLLNYGTVQSALGAGIQLDNRYLAELLTDLRDGQPDQRLFAKRLKWASACGQIVKVLYALTLTDSRNPASRQYASWEQAIKQAEQEWGRSVRGNRSSFHVQLRRFQPVLHFCGAFEMAREGPRRPDTVEALLVNAMTLYDMLRVWHVKRSFPGSRNDYLAGDIFWRWEGSTYDGSCGIPDIGISLENLIPHGRSGRPRKPR